MVFSSRLSQSFRIPMYVLDTDELYPIGGLSYNIKLWPKARTIGATLGCQNHFPADNNQSRAYIGSVSRKP